jgi:hypothetical protein
MYKDFFFVQSVKIVFLHNVICNSKIKFVAKDYCIFVYFAFVYKITVATLFEL